MLPMRTDMGQALIGIAQGDLNAQMQYADALARLSTAGTEEAPRGRRKPPRVTTVLKPGKSDKNSLYYEVLWFEPTAS